MKNTLPFALCLAASLLVAGCDDEPAPLPEAPPAAPPAVPQPAPVPIVPTPAPGGAASADDVQRETSEALDAAGSYLGAKKDQWLAAGKQKLEELDKQTADLQREAATKADSLSAEAKARWQRFMEESETERAAARQKWEQLKDAGGAALQDAAKKLDAALEEAEESLNHADAELDNPGPATPQN